MAWPAQPPPGASPGDAMASAKPKWFDVVVILALVLAGMGLLAGLSSLISFFAARGGGGMFMPDVPPEMREMQAELHKKIYEASMPGVSATLGIANLAVCGYALWTAIMMLKRRAGACSHFVRSMLGLGLLEIVAALFAMVIQSRVWRIMEGFMTDMMDAGGKGAPAPQEVRDTVGIAMQVGLAIGVVIGIGWAALKIGFCFYARQYGSKPEVISFVEGERSPV